MNKISGIYKITNIITGDFYIGSSKDVKKRWYKTYREYYLNRNKEYNNRLCLYEGKTLTLNALDMRFRRQGIAYPYKEAKKYLQGDIRDE